MPILVSCHTHRFTYHQCIQDGIRPNFGVLHRPILTNSAAMLSVAAANKNFWRVGCRNYLGRH